MAKDEIIMQSVHFRIIIIKIQSLAREIKMMFSFEIGGIIDT
jgi:hypothetical protein